SAHQWMLGIFCVVCSVRNFATLLFTRTTRYGRPVAPWNVGVKVIGPPSVLNFVRWDRIAASLAPFVEPPAFLIAYTIASIASAPVMKPPVWAGCLMAAIFASNACTAADGSGASADA